MADERDRKSYVVTVEKWPIRRHWLTEYRDHQRRDAAEQVIAQIRKRRAQQSISPKR
ncbi:MAG TPA: hypothetical protein VEB21_17735 [Terriglobales bacterium]|nr:hypothetical protein [Terriglobales bacterium]